MKTVEYTIKDELGLHARPAGLFVKEAVKNPCKVTLSKGAKNADAKKIFSVMGLGVKCGDTVCITCDGDGEDAAADALLALLQANV